MGCKWVDTHRHTEKILPLEPYDGPEAFLVVTPLIFPHYDVSRLNRLLRSNYGRSLSNRGKRP